MSLFTPRFASPLPITGIPKDDKLLLLKAVGHIACNYHRFLVNPTAVMDMHAASAATWASMTTQSVNAHRSHLLSP